MANPIFGLKLNKFGRIMEAIGYYDGIENDHVMVTTLPDGNNADYLYINGEYVLCPLSSLEGQKQTKKLAMSTACEQSIAAGIDVQVSTGVEHFSLSAHDQTNLTNMNIMVAAGAPGFPYHSDGHECRMFSAAEITAIAAAATRHVTQNTTLNNMLGLWINRIEDEEELGMVTYIPDNLPADLKQRYEEIIGVLPAEE